MDTSNGRPAEQLAARWMKGLLESCVIGVLRSGPAYGYEIASRIEGAGFARPRGGSLYPILARLEADDLVTPSWEEGDHGPGRKYYRLTPRGRHAADGAARQWVRFAEQVTDLIDAPDPAAHAIEGAR